MLKLILLTVPNTEDTIPHARELFDMVVGVSVGANGKPVLFTDALFGSHIKLVLESKNVERIIQLINLSTVNEDLKLITFIIADISNGKVNWVCDFGRVGAEPVLDFVTENVFGLPSNSEVSHKEALVLKLYNLKDDKVFLGETSWATLIVQELLNSKTHEELYCDKIPLFFSSKISIRTNNPIHNDRINEMIAENDSFPKVVEYKTIVEYSAAVAGSVYVEVIKDLLNKTSGVEPHSAGYFDGPKIKLNINVLEADAVSRLIVELNELNELKEIENVSITVVKLVDGALVNVWGITNTRGGAAMSADNSKISICQYVGSFSTEGINRSTETFNRLKRMCEPLSKNSAFISQNIIFAEYVEDTPVEVEQINESINEAIVEEEAKIIDPVKKGLYESLKSFFGMGK